MPTVQASTPSKPVQLIPLSEPTLKGREWRYVKECLDSGWVSSAGPFVERFEQRVAEYVGTSHAVATVNGTAALHIALRIMGVREDDEVLVSTLTFIAPVNAIRYCGAHPVFIDADTSTWQMDVRKVEQFLKECCVVKRGVDGAGAECRNHWTGRRVRAILPVHILGLACDMKPIIELAQHYHLAVVEDAAEGMGVRYRSQHVGWWGNVGVLSFNGNKIMTCGGGGMIVMNHQPVTAQYARYLTTQAKDDEQEYIHREVGYNYRLTNLQAAVGLAQLEQLDGFIKKKRTIARIYEEGLRDLEGITLMPKPPPEVEPTYWLYTILLRGGTTVPQRQEVVARLLAAGIEARPLWHPIHSLPPYQDCQATAASVADDLYTRAVSLPSSVELTEAQQDRVIAALHTWVDT